MDKLTRDVERIILASRTTGAHPVTTMTVDIFDTVLLRDVWPEELQFAEVSKAWLPVFTESINATITEYELTSYRIFARKMLWEAGSPPQDASHGVSHDREVSADAWFRFLIQLLEDKYRVALSSLDKDVIVEQLIAIELTVELQHLRRNDALVASLTNIKEKFGLTVYFVSDMYLSSPHVNFLLDSLGVKLFDDGITSSDVGRGKGTRNLYRYLNVTGHFPGFSTTTNVHIGDNDHSDYRSAVAEGSQAILVRDRHHLMRDVRNALGKRQLRRQQARERVAIRKKFTEHFENSFDAIRIGALFGAAAAYYLSGVLARARNRPDLRYLAVSSEATFFERLWKHMGVSVPGNVGFEPRINRKRVLGSVLKAAVESEDTYSFSAQNIMRFSEGEQGPSQLLNFLGTAPPELLTNNMESREYGKFLLSQLAKSREIGPQSAGAVGLDVPSALGLDKSGELILLDVGWNGSIQVFVRELVKLIESPTDVSGLYLAARPAVNPFDIDRGRIEGFVFDDIDSEDLRDFFVPEVWEYILSDKPAFSTQGLHQLLQSGVLQAVDLWATELHCSPDELWQAVEPQLKALLRNPSVAEVELLGSISWDVGFLTKKHYSLVDLTLDKQRVFWGSFLKPRKALRTIARLPGTTWKRGYVAYYRLGHLVPILRLFSKLRGVRYI